MTDILARLRDRSIMNGYPSDQCPKMMATMEEAANEIERLCRLLAIATNGFNDLASRSFAHAALTDPK